MAHQSQSMQLSRLEPDTPLPAGMISPGILSLEIHMSSVQRITFSMLAGVRITTHSHIALQEEVLRHLIQTQHMDHLPHFLPQPLSLSLDIHSQAGLLVDQLMQAELNINLEPHQNLSPLSGLQQSRQ